MLVDIKDYTLIDQIILEGLKEQRDSLQGEIVNLSAKGSLKKFEKEDLADAIEVESAISRVIKYYSIPE